MTIFFLTSLFIFGTLFGSFASVLIWRIKSGEGGIATGRSHCPKCNNTLGPLDLFPIFSYLFLRGKCRFCKAPISPVYPFLELTMGALFAVSGYFLVDQSLIFSLSPTEIARLVLVLSAAFVTVVFVFYDLLFLEIPDEVLLPFIAILGTLLVLDTWNGTSFFSHFEPLAGFFGESPIINGLVGSFIIYTFFYLQIIIPGIIYAIREKKLKLIPGLLLEYLIFIPYVFIHLFKKKNTVATQNQEEIEIPAWVGHGDLRIALFMGLFAGTKIALLGLLISYFCGSIIGVSILLYTRNRNTTTPFGPYLALGLYIALFWYTPIIDWYTKLFVF